eukprot:gene11011-12259_t
MRSYFKPHPSFNTFLRPIRRSLITGRATPEATKAFVTRSKLPLFYKFDNSGLFAVPVLHGSQADWTALDSVDQDYVNGLAAHAIENNRVNAMVVFEYDSTARKEYRLTSLEQIFSDPGCDIRREEAITIANLGLVCDEEELKRRFLRAKSETQLEVIDYVLMELNDSIFDSNRTGLIGQSIQTLQSLCEEGRLQGYGIRSCLAPFHHHKPLREGKDDRGAHMIQNAALEKVAQELKYFEIMAYPINPTIGIPSTYPLMLPSEEDLEEYKGKNITLSTDGIPPPELRTYTRIATNVLNCSFNKHIIVTPEIGLSKVGQELQALKAKESQANNPDSVLFLSGVHPPDMEGALMKALDKLCPALASSETLQEKAIRVALSAETDLVMVDAEASAVMGKFLLTADKLLDSDETDELFERFFIPPP